MAWLKYTVIFEFTDQSNLFRLTSNCKVGPSWQLTVWPGSSWQLSGYCQAAASVARSMGQYPEEGRRSGHLETAPVVTPNTATLLLHCDTLWTLLQSAGWPRGWQSVKKTLSSNIMQQASYSYDVTNSVLIDIYVLSIPYQFFISRSPLQFEKNNICLDWKRFTVVVKRWSVWPGIIFGLWRPGDRPPPSHRRHQQQLSSGHRATILIPL